MRAAAALALAGVLAAAPACGRYGAGLRRREVVVTFRPGASAAQHLAARAACARLPHASPEPVPSSTLPATRLSDVRFRVDDASDYDLQRLYDCLRAQPGVVGVDIPDTSQ